VGITRSIRRIGSKRLETILRSLLDAAPLCAIATVSGTRAHVNTAYFAWSDDFRVVWISDPRARHSRNVRARRTAAITVFDSHQTWGNSDRGVQLFGSAREIRGRAAERAREVYARRFPDYDSGQMADYRTYELRPRRAKLFDERELGAGVFVTARIGAGGAVSWVRTDVYTAAA
jgi:uncharacterized protein YhbP (UPF0306 family)